MLFVAIVVGSATLYLAWRAVRPLTDSATVTAEDWQRIDDQSMALLGRRDRIVEQLRDLEFEAALNKIDDRDLASLRQRFEDEALGVMERLDEAHDVYRERIDADLAAEPVAMSAEAVEPEAPIAPSAVVSKPEPAKPLCHGCDAELAPDTVFCDMCGAPTQPVSCGDCGAENRRGARFCKRCGAPMETGEVAAT